MMVAASAALAIALSLVPDVTINRFTSNWNLLMRQRTSRIEAGNHTFDASEWRRWEIVKDAWRKAEKQLDKEYLRKW